MIGWIRNNMLKKIIRDLGAQKALSMLTSSKLGRALLRKSLSIMANKLNIPITVETNVHNNSKMIFSFGESGSNLYFQCTIHTETLAELTELAGSAWINGTKLSKDDILPVLQKATRTSPDY